MQPAQLRASSFADYPSEARKLAGDRLALLQELPLVLVPILLRELIAYDWKLPAERRELQKQFTFLSGLSAVQRAKTLEGLRALPLSADLDAVDWVNNPSAFMEQLTAWLWSTHQMDRFRAVADTYASAVNESVPDPVPSMGRLGIVVIGAGVKDTAEPLFRKLRPSGVHLTRVKPEGGFATLLAEGARRVGGPRVQSSKGAVTESGFLHWYVDGGAPPRIPGMTQVSYARLEPSRAMLLEQIQKAIGSGAMGPEGLRSLLARMKPSDVGLSSAGDDAVLDHFQLSLLTEGAGTQIFATTFVQWTARECVRRAHPETLIVRYAPRQQAQTMNTMLSGAKVVGTDAAGSLVDADMGAYYTWLNLRRLTGTDQLRFLVWFEGHREAVVIGPELPHGTTSDSILDMQQVLALLG